MGNIVAKGIISIGAARFIFIISSYALHVFLGRYLGPADYGVIGIILALLTFFRIFLKDGLFHTVSRFTAIHSNQSRSIRKRILKIQLVFVFFISSIYFISANLIAYFLHDPKFIPLIRLSTLILPLMAINFIYMASLNGLRLFHKQAFGSGFYGTMRFLCVLVLAWFGFKIYGIIIGLILAPLLTLILVRYLCISSEPDQEGSFFLPIKEILPFAAPIILFSAGITLLMSLDLFFVKSILRSDNQTGFYTATTMIGKVPYHFIVSFTMTLFPSISQAYAQQNLKQIRRYIGLSVKYITHIMVPIVTIIFITSPDLISLIYSKQYIPSSQPLAVIIWGNMFLAYFLLCSTILMAIGKPKIPFFFLCFSLPISIILNLTLIPKYSLIGAAIATSISHLISLILAVCFIISYLKIYMPIKAIFIIILGMLSIIAGSYIIPFSGFFLLLKYGILILIYTMIMFILKEINMEDIKIIKGIFLRTKQI